MTLFFRCGFLFAFYFIAFNGIFAQNPTFQKIYRSIYQDQGLDCIQTSNGYLISGWSRNSMGSDGFLIHVNWQGGILWQKYFGGPVFELLRYLTAANDGGFLAYGRTGNLGNFTDAWLVKTNEHGDLLWQKRLGALPTSEAPSAPIIPVTDGYVLSGEVGQGTTTKLGSFIAKVNNEGETLWSRLLTMGDQADSSATKRYGVHLATDTALYATGTNGNSVVFVALDPFTGDVTRAIEYRNPHHTLRSFGLKPTLDGNLMVMGIAEPLDQNLPVVVWALKSRPDGNVIWSKIYMSEKSWLSPVFRFNNVSDGGFILSLEESQINGATDRTLLIKINADGEFVWKRVLTLDGDPNKFKYLSHIFEDSTGHLVSTGWINNPSSEVLLIISNPTGETPGCCSKTRNSIPPVDLPVEAVVVPFEQTDYLPFVPVDLSPQFQIDFLAEDICWVPQPTLHDTLRFCPGDSVTLGGAAYDQPGAVSFLVPSSTDDCDTLANYTLEYEAADPNATLQINCPANITVQALAGANSAAVAYDEPIAWSDCNCPDLTLVRTGGPASGELFPLGATTVCYQANDACANNSPCCFTVSVAPPPPDPSEPCDTKTSGCLQFELMQVNRDHAQNWAYHIRLTNTCADAVRFAYLQVPNGLQALAPINNIVYTTANGHTFTARNPNFSPFYSVRFHFAATTLANGQSETFRYVLPPQAAVTYIHAAARLYSGAYIETYLNTFSCPVGLESLPKPEVGERSAEDLSAEIKVYPNPVTHERVLNVQGAVAEGGFLVLHDLTGRIVLEGPVRNSQVQLGDARLPDGMYFFSIYKSGRKLVSGKLAVLR